MSDTQESPPTDVENVVQECCENKNLDLHDPKRVIFSSQEYSDMRDDPTMRYKYTSGRPAAGLPSHYDTDDKEEHHTGRRHYKSADEGFESVPDPNTVQVEMSPTQDHSPKPEGAHYTGQEYSDMKDVPSMRYEYSSARPAAGMPTNHGQENNTETHPSGRRHYQMASDILNTGPDPSGASTPEQRSKQGTPEPAPLDMSTNSHQNLHPEGIAFSSQEYSDMKGDPSMRYEYSSGRPAAGIRSNREPSPSRRRQYETAENVVDTEVDNSTEADEDDGNANQDQ